MFQKKNFQVYLGLMLFALSFQFHAYGQEDTLLIGDDKIIEESVSTFEKILLQGMIGYFREPKRNESLQSYNENKLNFQQATIDKYTQRIWYKLGEVSQQRLEKMKEDSDANNQITLADYYFNVANKLLNAYFSIVVSKDGEIIPISAHNKVTDFIENLSIEKGFVLEETYEGFLRNPFFESDLIYSERKYIFNNKVQTKAEKLELRKKNQLKIIEWVLATMKKETISEQENFSYFDVKNKYFYEEFMLRFNRFINVLTRTVIRKKEMIDPELYELIPEHHIETIEEEMRREKIEQKKKTLMGKSEVAAGG